MFKYILKTRIKTVLLVITCITFLIVYIITHYLTTIKTPVDISKYPMLIWWTPFMLESIKVIKCDNSRYQCILTKNRKYGNHSNLASYLFYGSNFDQNDLPLPKNNIPWAIFHEESPKNLAFFIHRKGQRLFDIISTFSRHSDFPLTLQFLSELDQLTDTGYHVSLVEKNRLTKHGIAPILYIQSDCDTPSERDSIVRELMQYIKVDSYGACLNNKELPGKYNIERTLEDLYEPNIMNFVARYKFVIAIENAVCHDYITEKLWRPLIAGSIPIYLGSPTIKDWLPNNNSAILIQDYNNISDLAKYIQTINANDDLYEQYMQHKTSDSYETKITNDVLKTELQKGYYGIENNKEFPIPAFECFVCKTIHENSFRTATESAYDCEEPTSRDLNNDNWWKTHWKMGECQAKTLQYFLNSLKLSNFTKEMFDIRSNKYFNDNDC